MVDMLFSRNLDFAAVVAEHAPFDPMTLDRRTTAARAGSMQLPVRIPAPVGGIIPRMLDIGADIVAPHVDRPEDAAAVMAAHHVGGRRGISPSPRAAAAARSRSSR